MLIKKITDGFVVQVFDTKLGKFISQEFEANDGAEYVSESGGRADPELLKIDGKEVYLPFEMIQPILESDIVEINEGDTLEWESDGTIRYIDRHGNCENKWEPGDVDYDRYKNDYFPNHIAINEDDDDDLCVI